MNFIAIQNGFTILLITSYSLAFTVFLFLLIFFIVKYQKGDIIAIMRIQLIISFLLTTLSLLNDFLTKWIEPNLQKILCSIFLYIKGFSNNSFFVISGFISYLLIKSFNNPYAIIQKFEYYVKISILIAWILPMLLSIIFYSFDVFYHKNFGDCNYSDDYIKNIQKCLSLLFFCFIFYQFCRLRVKVKALLKEHAEVNRKKMKHLWIIYCALIINIICFIPDLILINSFNLNIIEIWFVWSFVFMVINYYSYTMIAIVLSIDKKNRIQLKQFICCKHSINSEKSSSINSNLSTENIVEIQLERDTKFLL